MTMQLTQRKTQSAGRAARLRFALQMAEQSQKVGDRIAYEREKMELSRPALARELPGVTTGNDVYRWEKGKHLPRADTMEALAKLFGISVADLYAGVPANGRPDTSDLSDALSEAEPDSGTQDQLNRIEQKLDSLLEILEERFLSKADAQSAQDAETEQSRGTRRAR